ncbi:MAG: SIMPL domain-containing protein [Firmicutes bacterium]|jgi:uncharacterized protein YggE|nr:SIMPL domain-containing protein [Bacillota bacterium]
MRSKLILVVLVVTALMMGSFGSFAAEGDQLGSVTVNGEGSISVFPDIAFINVGVVIENENASVAQAENNKVMKTVIEEIKKLGIDKKDILTSGFSVYNRKDYNDKNEKSYYVVSNNLNITVRNIDDLGRIIDVATANGANNINGITFDYVDKDKVYNEALKQAMKDAKAKANTITTTFGKTVTVPSSVNEIKSYSDFYRGGVAMDALNAKVSSTPIESGALVIKAEVNVTYGY